MDERYRLTPSRLAFADPDVEQTYQAYHLRELAHFLRLGSIASLLAWPTSYVVLGLRLPEHGADILVSAAIVLPTLVTAWIVASRRRPLRHLTAFVSFAYLVPTANAIYYGQVVLGETLLTVGAVIMLLWTAFIVHRLRFVPATLLGVISLAGFQVALLHAGTDDVVLPTLVVWTAGTMGFIVAFGAEQSSRRAFAQEQLIADQRERIAEEMAKADRLLLNILPEPIAARLKDDAASVAERHPAATVLFADIVGFTPLSATLDPEALVALLNDIFSRFDDALAAAGLEKIKTIGDAYMAVAGAPEAREDHAVAAAELALRLVAIVDGVNASRGTDLAIRVGLHSGPVVAGVIGKLKFAYDLWGDTVNVAARMESHGVPGRVQVSPGTRALLEGRYAFEERGAVEVKGKGPMVTSLIVQ